MGGKGKYSLESVMKELEAIKVSQKRYEEKYVESASVGAACSSLVTGDRKQEEQLKSMKEAIGRIEKILEDVARSTRENERKLDDLEQYGRRNCLILHGCKNVPKKGSYYDFEKFVVDKLNSRLCLDYKIKSLDIDTCHILPSRSPRKDGWSPIIIKFVRRSVRDLVYSNKRKLKSANNREKLSITESLTSRRLTLLLEARKAFGYYNVWTSNGTVYCAYNDSRQVLDDFGDIDKILDYSGYDTS